MLRQFFIVLMLIVIGVLDTSCNKDNNNPTSSSNPTTGNHKVTIYYGIPIDNECIERKFTQLKISSDFTSMLTYNFTVDTGKSVTIDVNLQKDTTNYKVEIFTSTGKEIYWWTYMTIGGNTQINLYEKNHNWSEYSTCNYYYHCSYCNITCQ